MSFARPGIFAFANSCVQVGFDFDRTTPHVVLLQDAGRVEGEGEGEEEEEERGGSKQREERSPRSKQYTG